MPYYTFKDFKIACCEDSNNVIPINNVMIDASSIFNLRTKKQLLDFICNDGLENLQFVNTKDWENNPNKTDPIKVDAYEFRTMSMLGYISFMFNPKTKKWLIKSFHLSENRNLAMMIALQKAGCLELEDKNGK